MLWFLMFIFYVVVLFTFAKLHAQKPFSKMFSTNSRILSTKRLDSPTINLGSPTSFLTFKDIHLHICRKNSYFVC